MNNYLSKYSNQTLLDAGEILDQVEGIDEAFQNIYANMIKFAGSILPVDGYQEVEKALINSIAKFNEDIETLADITNVFWAGHHPIPHMFSRLRWYGEKGVFHYTDTDVVAKSEALLEEIKLSQSFIESLPITWMQDDKEVTASDNVNIFEEIIAMSLARYALDSGENLTFQQVVTLSGMSKRAVQNDVAKKADDSLIVDGDTVSNADAQAWLVARRNFMPTTILKKQIQGDSIQVEDELTDVEYEFVPVTDDGVVFLPEVKRKEGYQIGSYGNEVYYHDYFQALKTLQESNNPKFRRPNQAGNWGIKNVTSWKRIPRSQLEMKIK